MPRPRKIKTIQNKPDITYFKPHAVPLNQLEEVPLTFDELETLRLSNLEKLSQVESANKMNIHQSTFQRTLARAREKITDALVNGKAIKIQGGEYSTLQNKMKCCRITKGNYDVESNKKCNCPKCQCK